ncbi:MAG: dihydrofolate reductase [Nanoarchaeota archaeon]|nr:dihydrofolate reductase [Nanoarchaeota archaeon]
MELAIIVAISENNVIGNQGEIPWYIPEDFKRFKQLTLRHPVIMGRKTFESILKRLEKPLPERKNIVLTKKEGISQEGIYMAHSIREAIELCENQDSYVIGGKQVYERFLPLTNRIELTRVHRKTEGDVYFPPTNWDQWEEIFTENHGGHSFHTYKRKR